jgi:hypothetical protein
MATSGLVQWNLNVDEIVEAAFKKVGGEITSAHEAQDARRTLMFILYDLINRGVPLANIKEKSIEVPSSVRDVTLPTSVMDVLEGVIRTSTSAGSFTDLPMDRKSFREYLAIPTKDQTSRPTLFATERQRDNVNVRLWPTNDETSRFFVYYAITRPDDINTARENVDLPQRYLPALVDYLAYELSLNRRTIPEDYRQRLKNDYEEKLARAFGEDRERTSYFLVPKLGR